MTTYSLDKAEGRHTHIVMWMQNGENLWKMIVLVDYLRNVFLRLLAKAYRHEAVGCSIHVITHG